MDKHKEWFIVASVADENGVNIVHRLSSDKYHYFYRFPIYFIKETDPLYPFDNAILDSSYYFSIVDSKTAYRFIKTVVLHYNKHAGVMYFADWLKYWADVDAKFMLQYEQHPHRVSMQF
jgi:hypothetical protein